MNDTTKELIRRAENALNTNQTNLALRYMAKALEQLGS